MQPTRVYDLPTRAFHWLFAGLFITAFSIAQWVDDESARFSLHMLAGLAACFVVLLRLLWSAVGTRHARLSDLALAPRQLLAYLKGVVTGRSRHWAGHNPASSWAALAMVLLALGLGTTGLMMAWGGNDSVEDVHELMANAFLVVVLLHLGGLAIHALRQRDGLPAAMVTGRKQLEAAETPVRAHALAGVAFVALAGLFSGYLLLNFDAQDRTLQLFGQQLMLGEGEHGEGERVGGHDEDSDEDEHEEHG